MLAAGVGSRGQTCLIADDFCWTSRDAFATRSLSCTRADDRLRMEVRYGSCSSMNLMRFMNAERCERVRCGSGAAMSRRSKSAILAMRAMPFLMCFNDGDRTKYTRSLHVVKKYNTVYGRHVKILESRATVRS
jgi:hypothetical protein